MESGGHSQQQVSPPTGAAGGGGGRANFDKVDTLVFAVGGVPPDGCNCAWNGSIYPIMLLNLPNYYSF